MEHSVTYHNFIKHLQLSPREKDGYYTNLFENIYEWERNELEDIIWDHFHNNGSDFMLAYYLPQLKQYDGVNALINKLSECQIPGSRSLTIAKLLYEATDDDSYLDIFKENYEKSKKNLYPIVAELSYCKHGQKKFDMLCDIYVNCDEKLAVQCAALGIVFYIENIDPNTISCTEEWKYVSMIKPLIECEQSKRVEELKKLIERGQHDSKF